VAPSPSNAELVPGGSPPTPLAEGLQAEIGSEFLVDGRMPNRLVLPANEITLHAAATLESVG